MAARRRAGSFSPKTSRRLRISKFDMLLDMCPLLDTLTRPEKSPDGWSSLSPLPILTPSKPCLVLACIVRIKIDVQARYSAISKLEYVAETPARRFAACPLLARHSAL